MATCSERGGSGIDLSIPISDEFPIGARHFGPNRVDAVIRFNKTLVWLKT